MAPATNEEQFKFLISCIRYSNNGKIDFSEVAKECNIVSRGAANKRYERMMKAHGIAPSGNTGGAGKAPKATATPRTPKKDTGDSPSKGKKRKMDDFEDDSNNAMDDEEDCLEPKAEQFDGVNERLMVKAEDDQQAFLNSSSNLMRYPQLMGEEDSSIRYSTRHENPYGMADEQPYLRYTPQLGGQVTGVAAGAGAGAVIQSPFQENEDVIV